MAHNSSALIDHHDTIGLAGVIELGIDLGIELSIELDSDPGIEGSNGKCDVKMTQDIFIDKFAKCVTIAEPNISFQIMMLLSAFR
jgi:hypothetical protein